MDLNRNALLIYLRDCRDLEIETLRIAQIMNEIELRYLQADEELSQPPRQVECVFEELKQPRFKTFLKQKPSSVKKRLIRTIWDCFLVGLLLALAILFQLSDISTIIAMALISVAVVGFVVKVCIIDGRRIMRVLMYNKRITAHNEEQKTLIEQKNREIIATVKRENEKIMERNQKLRQQIEDMKQREQEAFEERQRLREKNRIAFEEQQAFWQSRYQIVCNLRSKGYALDIIAKPYRNFQSVHAIYEHMVYSLACFEEAICFIYGGVTGQQQLAEEMPCSQYDEYISKRYEEAQDTNHVNQILTELAHLQEEYSPMQKSSAPLLHSIPSGSEYERIAENYSAVNAYFKLTRI